MPSFACPTSSCWVSGREEKRRREGREGGEGGKGGKGEEGTEGGEGGKGWRGEEGTEGREGGDGGEGRDICHTKQQGRWEGRTISQSEEKYFEVRSDMHAL